MKNNFPSSTTSARITITPSQVYDAMSECGFETPEQALELAQSARLLTCDKESLDKIRTLYTILQERGLLPHFWAMFKNWRTSKAATSNQSRNQSLDGVSRLDMDANTHVWKHMDVTVILDNLNRTIVIKDYLDSPLVRVFNLNFSWECASPASAKRLSRIIAMLRSNGVKREIENKMKLC